jgi:hypothetical protein
MDCRSAKLEQGSAAKKISRSTYLGRSTVTKWRLCCRLVGDSLLDARNDSAAIANAIRDLTFRINEIPEFYGKVSGIKKSLVQLPSWRGS